VLWLTGDYIPSQLRRFSIVARGPILNATGISGAQQLDEKRTAHSEKRRAGSRKVVPTLEMS
jgi:hypothetical protein